VNLQRANLQPATLHWSFQPVRVPPIPAVKDRAWVKTPVDAFILAKLEAAGLEPAELATREHLLRRVTFDLTGLPPTPAEIDAFLADNRHKSSPSCRRKILPGHSRLTK